MGDGLHQGLRWFPHVVSYTASGGGDTAGKRADEYKVTDTLFVFLLEVCHGALTAIGGSKW